jgi:hypothetical protein
MQVAIESDHRSHNAKVPDDFLQQDSPPPARRVAGSVVPTIPDEVWRAGSEHTCDCQTGRHSPDVGRTRWPDDAVRQDCRGTAFETMDDSVLRILSGHLP